MGLDFLNLRLIDYEVSMDAFTGFRVHHLTPSPSSLREVCLQRPMQTEGETTPTASLVEELRLVRERGAGGGGGGRGSVICSEGEEGRVTW